MILFDPRTGQLVTIDPLPTIQETEANLEAFATRETAAPSDGRENAASTAETGAISTGASEQATSATAGVAAALAVIGALGALYLPLLWA